MIHKCEMWWYICGREGLERQEKRVKSLMDDPYLKLLCKKHNDQNHVFLVRDVSHIHMYVLMHSG